VAVTDEALMDVIGVLVAGAEVPSGVEDPTGLAEPTRGIELVHTAVDEPTAPAPELEMGLGAGATLVEAT
jgi:hypothetical protein